MANGLHDTGEEFMLKQSFKPSLLTDPTDITFLLYNHTTDALADADDISAITTEPDTSGDYARQTISYDGANISFTDNASDNWQVEYGNSTAIEFQTDSNTQEVDAYGVATSFDSTDAGDGGTPALHLIHTGDLEQSRNLSNYTSIQINPGLVLD